MTWDALATARAGSGGTDFVHSTLWRKHADGGEVMRKKKRPSFAQRFGHTVSDMANAASVAATGSEIGVLELAAEDELGRRPVKRAPKAKVRRKKAKSARPSKPAQRKRASKRR
jgi:hypothetical protein